jgi:hypothetical protein
MSQGYTQVTAAAHRKMGDSKTKEKTPSFSKLKQN